MDIRKKTVEAGKSIYLHCRRDRDQNCKYGNEKIDLTRSGLNENFENLPKTKEGIEFPFPSNYEDTMLGFIEASKAASEKNRAVARNAKCLITVVFTLPTEYLPPKGVDYNEWYTTDRRKKENEIFQSVLSFLVRKFGYKHEKLGHNFLYACVHRDETRPHMHVGFIPVVRETITYQKRIKKGSPETRTITVKKGTISAYEVINQKVFRTLHNELDRHLRTTVEWYKGGALRTDEERMMSGQNLRMKDLKKKGPGFAEKRAEENRRAFIAEAKSLYSEALKEIKADGHEASLIKLVEQLIKDGKLTKDDYQNNTTYHDSYDFYSAFKKALKERNSKHSDNNGKVLD